MGDHAFYFSSFEFDKKHPYTIIFVGTCTQISRTVKIEYSGAEIRTNASIPDSWLTDLKTALNNDYGHGEFTRSQINKIFEKHNHYVF